MTSKKNPGMQPLYIYTSCKNKQMNNLWTNQQNKTVHALANTLLALPSTLCFTLITLVKLKIAPLKTPYQHGYYHARATYPNVSAPLN